jgi:hypothetical protein
VDSRGDRAGLSASDDRQPPTRVRKNCSSCFCGSPKLGLGDQRTVLIRSASPAILNLPWELLRPPDGGGRSDKQPVTAVAQAPLARFQAWP